MNDGAPRLDSQDYIEKSMQISASREDVKMHGGMWQASHAVDEADRHECQNVFDCIRVSPSHTLHFGFSSRFTSTAWFPIRLFLRLLDETESAHDCWIDGLILGIGVDTAEDTVQGHPDTDAAQVNGEQS